MGLRREEDLSVQDIVLAHAAQVGPRHVVEVALVQKHAQARVVDVEEALQVREVVGRAQRVLGREPNVDVVAACEREEQLGLERALEMHVELHLGHALDKPAHRVVHPRPVSR